MGGEWGRGGRGLVFSGSAVWYGKNIALEKVQAIRLKVRVIE